MATQHPTLNACAENRVSATEVPCRTPLTLTNGYTVVDYFCQHLFRMHVKHICNICNKPPFIAVNQK